MTTPHPHPALSGLPRFHHLLRLTTGSPSFVKNEASKVNEPRVSLDSLDSNGPMVLPARMAQKNSYGVTTYPKAKIYTDPSNPDAPTDHIRYGVIHMVQDGTELTVDGETYVYIGGTRLGKALVNKLDFYVLRDRELQRPWYCDVEVPEGDQPECD